MKIISFDLDREWAKQVGHHMKICKNRTDTALIEASKRGYDFIDARGCDCCSGILEKRYSYDVKYKKNQKSSGSITRVSVSVFNKIGELLASIGLIYFSKTRAREHYK